MVTVNQAYGIVSHAVEDTASMQALQDQNSALQAQNIVLHRKLESLESLLISADTEYY
jgi:hypothetical protein